MSLQLLHLSLFSALWQNNLKGRKSYFGSQF
jgi:hypothetical protein